MDDRRILSMVKKTPFITSSQGKNTLQEVDVSLSKSTIKRRLHQMGSPQGANMARIVFAKKTSDKPDHF